MGCCNNKVYLYIDSNKTTKSTQLYGPRPALEYLVLQRKYLMPIVKKYNGVVHDICWDSFVASFDDPVSSIFAAEEMREVYRYNEEFLANREKSKIDIAAIALSKDKELCEELGENLIENGNIVIHGEELIESLVDRVWLYGFEFNCWTVKQFPKEKFVTVNRANENGSVELKNKVVLTFSPTCAAEKAFDKILKKYNTYRPDWLGKHLYIFDEKAQAYEAALDLYKFYEGSLTVALNHADEIVIHEKLRIVSSFGVNLVCKIAQDLDKDKPSLRITRSLFETAPSDKFTSRTATVSDVTINYWEQI